MHEETAHCVPILVVLFIPIASAETYRISGKATYGDGSPVSLDYVYVECEVGVYECYQYRGTKAMTDAYGDFTVVIDAGNEEDGLDILLTLRGENFTHIIDLTAHQNSPENKVYQESTTEAKPSTIRRIHGFWVFHCPICIGFCFGIATHWKAFSN